MTHQEAKQHLARKLNIDYSDIANNDLWTDTDLQTLLQLGVFKAWDYHPWPFTQKVKKATTISTDYYDHPSDIMNGSIYRLTVGGKEYKKVIAEDYYKFFEDFSSATDRIWTEVETYIFVNTHAYTVGDEMCLFGKKFPATLSSSSDLLPFSPTTDNYEHSGNEAIVLLAYAEALASEKKKMYAEAESERKKAYETLNVLWKPFADSKALLQSKGRPMFEVGDFFGQSGKGSQYTGNFNYL
jgi:hypothetical protein